MHNKTRWLLSLLSLGL